MKSLKYLIALIITNCSLLYPQTGGRIEFRGFPAIENFYSQELQIQEQNWAITQKPNDIIYVANIQELLEYDGVSWNNIETLNGTVRSLDVTKEGTVYLGSISDFGYLKSDSTNAVVYQSLLPLVNSDSINFSNVYQTIATDSGIYFRSFEYLFRYNNESVKTWKAETRFGRMYDAGGNLYINVKGYGLHKIVRDNIIPVPGGDLFANLFIAMMLEMDNGDILIGTRTNGYYLKSGDAIRQHITGVEDYTNNNRLYNGIKLNDGNIALSMLSGGVVIINPGGKLIRVINNSNGLQDNNVKNVFQDNQANIWAALNDGISRIEYSSPFEFFDRRMNLNGLVLSIIIKNNRLYAGTTSGLFIKENDENPYVLNNFQKIEGIRSLPWVLFDMGASILAGTNDGLFRVTDKTVFQLSDDRVYDITIIPDSERYVLLCTSNGIKLYDTERKHKNTIKIFSELDDEIASGIFNEQGDLWLGTLTQGVIRIKNISAEIEKTTTNSASPGSGVISRFYTEHGLPEGAVEISKVNNNIHFLTTGGIYLFNQRSNRFLPDSVFGSEFADGSRNVFRMAGDNNGDVWFHSRLENFHAEKQEDGSFEIIRKPFMSLPRDQVNIIYPGDNYVWFGTNKGIVRYDKNIRKRIDTTFSALIRKVKVGNDSLIYGGAPLPDDYKSKLLSYKLRNIRIEYASPFYRESDETEYKYILDGYDDEWSDWTSETRKDYTNLSEGSYTFFVKARNIYGDTSTIASYSFEILPPFYRTIWAYVFYILVVLAFGYMVVKWRIGKLEKEKKELERLIANKTKEVKEQADKLKELDKIKSRFFANISHEFRTPLTLIIGPAEQMLSEERSKEKKKKFSLILRNSQKLLELINQLLDLSRLDSGRIQLHVKKMNLVRLIKSVCSLFESLAHQKNISLDFNYRIDELELYGDPDKIEKILTNLISNAFKFTENSGSIKVSLTSNRAATGSFVHGYAEITIEDTGSGIDEKTLRNIFDPFYRGESSIQKEIEGSGIGLALVKEFVELHGGIINVTSTPGKGTIFTLKFPLGSDHLVRFGITEEEYEPSETGDPSDLIYNDEEVTPKNIEASDVSSNSDDRDIVLVVEDNTDVRNYIKESLEKDYKIVEAGNGKEGIKAAMDTIPDLIISDVMMPGMDGFEFCEHIKKDLNTSHIPVILLTAKSGDENIIKGLDTGADDYITKPFNVHILQTRIKNLIDLRKQLQNKFKRELLLQPSEFKVSSLDDKFLMKLHKLLESNYSDPDFNLDDLIENFNISRASLFRKIKSLTGDTPNKYLQSYRLKRAAQMIKQHTGNITEVAYSSGFSSSAYFTKCFKEKFDCLPSEYYARES